MPIKEERRYWYPSDWKVRSKFVRFYRAKQKCEWCGAENYKPHPVTGSKVVLTTAHIYNGIERPHQLLNLAALCQKCHLGYDMKDRVRNRKKNKNQLHFTF